MSDSYPLMYYDIKERDIIIVVPAESLTEQWISMTRNSEMFKDRVRNIIDYQTSQEMARIRDFQIAKIERRPKIFRRMCSSVNNPMTRTRSKPSFSLSRAPESPPPAPSAEPLPAFWASSCGVAPVPPMAPLSPLSTERQHSAPKFDSTVDQ